MWVVKRDSMSRVKLKDVTFTINDKPMSNLLWCNKVPKGKRNKPAKINGVQHSEVSDAVEHTYYMPVQWVSTIFPKRSHHVPY